MNGSATEPNDAERLRFLMQQELIEGFVSVPEDRYDFALMVAEENGREVPTLDDELEGFRMLIDRAMAGGDKS